MNEPISRASGNPAGGTSLVYVNPSGQFKGDVPLSLAVRAGNMIFVSGIPGFDEYGGIAAGDFPAQMTNAMRNVTRILAAAGVGWDRVARVRILLTRREDFAQMNRIYAPYFPEGNYPARTTAIVSSLPQPEFLVEIECEAIAG